MRALGDLAHLFGDLRRVLRRIERDERGHALGHGARRDHRHLHVGELRGGLRCEDDVLVVRQHDDVTRVRLADRAEQLLRGGVHRRATTQRRRAERTRHRREA